MTENEEMLNEANKNVRVKKPDKIYPQIDEDDLGSSTANDLIEVTIVDSSNLNDQNNENAITVSPGESKAVKITEDSTVTTPIQQNSHQSSKGYYDFFLKVSFCFIVLQLIIFVVKYLTIDLVECHMSAYNLTINTTSNNTIYNGSEEIIPQCMSTGLYKNDDSIPKKSINSTEYSYIRERATNIYRLIFILLLVVFDILLMIFDTRHQIKIDLKKFNRKECQILEMFDFIYFLMATPLSILLRDIYFGTKLTHNIWPLSTSFLTNELSKNSMISIHNFINNPMESIILILLNISTFDGQQLFNQIYKFLFFISIVFCLLMFCIRAVQFVIIMAVHLPEIVITISTYYNMFDVGIFDKVEQSKIKTCKFIALIGSGYDKIYGHLCSLTTLSLALIVYRVIFFIINPISCKISKKSRTSFLEKRALICSNTVSNFFDLKSEDIFEVVFILVLAPGKIPRGGGN